MTLEQLERQIGDLRAEEERSGLDASTDIDALEALHRDARREARKAVAA